MIRIFVAARYPVIQAGIERALSSAPSDGGLRIVGRSQGVRTTIDGILEHQPDVALLALDQTGQAGIVVARHLKGRVATRLVLLAAEYSEHDVIEALQLGVCGMLLLSLESGQLVRCVGKVARGARWLELDSSSRALDRLLFHRPRPAERPLGLSEREFQVVSHVAAGLGTTAIAETMGVSRSTVKFHLRSVYQKLHITSRVELIQKARAEALSLGGEDEGPGGREDESAHFTGDDAPPPEARAQ